MVVEEGEEVAVGSLGTLRRVRCIIPCRLMLLHLPRHSYNSSRGHIVSGHDSGIIQ
jgi:hypothetical protein